MGPCGILQRGALPDFKKQQASMAGARVPTVAPLDQPADASELTSRMPVHNRPDDLTGFRELRPAMAHKTVVADGHPQRDLRAAMLAHMQKRGLTQTEAARQIGVQQPQLSRWLRELQDDERCANERNSRNLTERITASIARCDALRGRAWLT